MAPGRNVSSQGQSIGLALGRLRIAVVTCCWIVGLALALQLVVWSLSAYTQMRFTNQEETTAASEPTVVVAESPRQQRIRQAREADMGVELGADETALAEPARVFSSTDATFAATYNLVTGIGRCAMLALIPLMMVGVMLSAGSATPGVDRVVSSLTWAMVVAVLVLPLGGAFSLPWDAGALTSYEHMTSTVDRVEQASETGNQDGASSLAMHSRFGLLPLACLVGVTLVGLRFCSGVEAGILAGENMRLDPALEREAANISPSSLHAGRSTGVLNQAMKGDAIDRALPTAKTVSVGQSPQRLI